MKKRIFAWFVLCVMLLSLAGCGTGTPASGSEVPESVSSESEAEAVPPVEVDWTLDDEAFAHPDDQYRMLKIANTIVKMYPEDVLRDYCDTLGSYGYAGFVGNVSWTNHYLESEKAWGFFTEQVQWAADEGERLWIYDEQGYPSGAAGTLVLDANPEYEALGVAQVRQTVKGGQTVALTEIPASHTPLMAVAYPDTGDVPVLADAVDLQSAIQSDNTLVWTAPDGEWVVEYYLLKPLYEETHAAGNVYADRRYVNIMDADAIASFLQFTHERYYEHVGDYFGSAIEAFFTDEPSLMGFYTHDYEGTPVTHPQAEDFVRYPTAVWSRDFAEQFEARRGYDLLPYLTCLFNGNTEEFARIRNDYRLTVSELVEEAYFQQIGDWCDAHGVASSGHQLAEENLYSQVMVSGNFLRNFSHQGIIGIDLLTSDPETLFHHCLTVKLAASANRLYNKGGVMSEDSTFSDRDEGNNLTVSLDEIRSSFAVKYALGVTQVTSYYNYNEIAEEGCAREERALTGDLIARLGYALDQGEHVADVMLYYPIESAYAELLPTTTDWGNDLTMRMSAVENSYKETLKLLLNHQLDVDLFETRSILESQIDGSTLVSPGGERFRVVVVPQFTMMETALLEKLLACADAGIGVVLLDQSEGFYTPSGEDTEAAYALWDTLCAHENVRSGYNNAAVGNVVRELLGTADLTLADDATLLYNHMTHETGDVYLLSNYTDAAISTDAVFRATGAVRLLDPFTGEETLVEPIASDDATTTLRLELPAYGYTLVEFAKVG